MPRGISYAQNMICYYPHFKRSMRKYDIKKKIVSLLVDNELLAEATLNEYSDEVDESSLFGNIVGERDLRLKEMELEQTRIEADRARFKADVRLKELELQAHVRRPNIMNLMLLDTFAWSDPFMRGKLINILTILKGLHTIWNGRSGYGLCCYKVC